MSESGRERLETFRPEVDGSWNRAAAAHLVRRATLGAPRDIVDRVLELGPEKSPRFLLDLRGSQKGVDVVADSAWRVGNLESAQGWWVYRMISGTAPALDKLAVFWHGHFATSDEKVNNSRLMMRQIDLFLEKGTGPFGDLLIEISRDPAMLVFLDGNSNRRGRPNENYARELMELFSLGIGNYTENDIKEAARAFTGWHVRRDEFWFNKRAHDTSEKTVFGKKGDFGGDQIVDLCLEKPACPQFIACKLFEYYVRLKPDAKLGEALGGLYEACGKRTGEFLTKLWSSRVFFAKESRRALVASPVDFVVGSLRTLGARANGQQLAKVMSLMGQELLEPPSVKGWDGGMIWLNSNTLISRFRFAAALAGRDDLQATVPWDEFASSEKKSVVRNVVDRFFPESLPEAVVEALEEAAGDDAKLAVTGCLQLPENQYV